MNVFLCWSGQRGLLVAEVLKGWLEQVFPGCVEARVSTDIEKGAIWRDELEKFLRESRAGLLCITPEALASPWVNFEAGFLARAIGSTEPGTMGPSGQLFTFLLGATASDLTGPLAEFQSTDASDRRDTERLVKALHRLIPAEERQSQELVDKSSGAWDRHWETLRNRLALIPQATLFEVCPSFSEAFRRKTFEEPIDECMRQEWVARFCGARDTLSALKTWQPCVATACRRYVRELMHALISELDAYADALSELIGGRYQLEASGKRAITPPGLGVACERRRCSVRRLVARLEDPPPFFNEAVRFDAAESLEEAKSIVHRVEPSVRAFAKLTGGAKLDQSWPEQAACFRIVRQSKQVKESVALRNPKEVDLDLHWRTSRWEFDRIMYAVYLRSGLEHSDKSARSIEEILNRALDFAEEQLDIVRAQALDELPELEQRSSTVNIRLMALHCSLTSVEAAERRLGAGVASKRVHDLAQGVLETLDAKERQHESTRRSAERLRERAVECLIEAPGRPPPSAATRGRPVGAA